ncbi:hypothetical protein Tco_1355415 [Tanacetum coccineum]
MKRVSRGYTGIDFSLFPTLISAPKTSPSRITSSPSLSPQHTPVSTPSTSQPPNTQPTPDAEEAVPMPHKSPLHSVHSLGRDEGSLSLNDLTDLCTSLSNKVQSLDTELKETKQTYNSALTQLIRRVKKLEHIVKASKSRRRARVVESDDEEDLEDPSKQGRNEGRNDDTQIYDLPSRAIGVISGATALSDAKLKRRKAKDKGGKEIYASNRPPKKVKKRVQVQMSMDEELANKLDEREEVAAEPTQAQQIDWSDPAVLRYHAQLNRPYSIAEVRKNMVMYLKNQGGYKMNYFKGIKYEDIRPIFEKVWDQIQSFAPMDSEKEKDSEKKGSRKKSLARKRAGEKQSEESTKRQKIEDDVEKEELKAYLDLVPREEFAMEIESLATKYPIVDWKTYVLTENFMYYQIFRADGSSKNYKIFSEMLDDFGRQNVLDLHKLVKARKDAFTPLIKTPKEILAMESVNFPKPPPLIETPEKQNLTNFVITTEIEATTPTIATSLKKQIEEVVASRKLAHLVKDIRQNNQRNGSQRRNNVKVINMIRGGGNRKRPFEEVRSGLTDELTFPSIPRNQLTDKPIILEGVTEGHQVRRILVDGGSSSEIMYEHCFRNFNVNIQSRTKKSKTPKKETPDANEDVNFQRVSKTLQAKTSPRTPRHRVVPLQRNNRKGFGVGDIPKSVLDEEDALSSAIRLNFNTSNHAMDCEALLVKLVTSVSKGMKYLHVFINSPKLVAQIEGNHMPATEQEMEYKEEIMDATTPFHRFWITHL